MSRCPMVCVALMATMVALRGPQDDGAGPGDARGAPPRAAARLARADDEPKVRDLLLSDDEEEDRAAALEKALASRVKVEFAGVPLRECLEKLCQEQDVDIVFDEAAISEGHHDLNQKVNLKLAGVHFQSVLDLLLEPRELEWLLRHEVLFVTTRQAAASLLEVRSYNVRPLAEAGHDTSALREAIMACIEPESWTEVGGTGEVKITGEVLVIRAMQRVHVEVERLLAELDEHAEQDEEDEEARRARDAAITTTTYRTGPALAERLEKVLPGIVAPNTWDQAGGQGRLYAVEHCLVVVQTRAVQRQIARLIRELMLPLQAPPFWPGGMG